MRASSRPLCRALVVAALSSRLAASHAGEPMAPPAWAGRNLATSWSLAGNGRLEQPPARDLPGEPARALRVTVPTAAKVPWEVQLRAPLGSIAAGRRLGFRFWARAPAGNWIRALVETDRAPWTTADQAFLKLTADWQPYALEMVVPPGQGQPLGARLQLGGAPGTFELARVEVLDLGPDPALAGAAAALRPEAIRERIQRTRMGELVVRVTDAKGSPVPGARVEVAMTRHAFLFGSNAFGLFRPKLPQFPEYERRFSALFNYATLPVYWSILEPRRGEPQYAQLEGMADWALQRGLASKGHPLVWHELYPGWAPADPAAAVPLLEQRVGELVARERSRIRTWDVFNEASINWFWPPRNGEQRWIERDGQAAAVEAALGWARRADPGATLVYNDDNTGAANLALLAQLERDGALPDAIGIQSHMHTGLWPLERVWQVCERFARFGKPIHFSEVTVLSGPLRDDPWQYKSVAADDWLTTPQDEQRQAEYVGQLYSVLFSHPAVQAVSWWDLSDLDAWLGAPAGLLRPDMTPKPAYDRLMQLIHREWWTNASGPTEADGGFRTRAFYGEYAITVVGPQGRKAERKLVFPAGAGRAEVRLSLPGAP